MTATANERAHQRREASGAKLDAAANARAANEPAPETFVAAPSPAGSVPQGRRELQRRENQTIGDADADTGGTSGLPAWTADEMREYVYLIESRGAGTPCIGYVVGGAARVTNAAGAVLLFKPCKTTIPPKSPGTDAKVVSSFNMWLEDPRRKVLAGFTHTIGFPMLFKDPRLYGGEQVLNTWKARPPVTEQRAGLVLFLDHVRYIFRDRADDFLRWLAHCEQKPTELPHQGWLSICTTHGIGRNWLASVLTRVWAGEVAASLDLAALLDGSFNNRISGKRLAVVDEINLASSGKSKHSLMARRRQLMTEEVRRTNGKFAVEFDELNMLRWLIFSNHADAMPMDAQDRRDEVVFGPTEPRSPEYYGRLYRLLAEPIFIAAVRWYLAELDISGYNPGKRAELSGDKLRAIKASRSVLCSTVAEWIEDNPGRQFATMRQMIAASEAGDTRVNLAEWKHVIRELGLLEVACDGARTFRFNNPVPTATASRAKAFMLRGAAPGWRIELLGDGVVRLEPDELGRLQTELEKGD